MHPSLHELPKEQVGNRRHLLALQTPLALTMDPEVSAYLLSCSLHSHLSYCLSGSYVSCSMHQDELENLLMSIAGINTRGF